MKNSKLLVLPLASAMVMALASPVQAADKAATVSAQHLADEIVVHVDNRAVQPMLNVVLDRGSKQISDTGDTVAFKSWWNYDAFIVRAEIRLFKNGDSSEVKPVHVLPIDANRNAEFTRSDSDPAAIFYVLRVYDATGRFDETRPMQLREASDTGASPDVLVGSDKSSTRKIEVGGAKIDISGYANPESKITFASDYVIVGEDGRFSFETIMPFGKHDITVEINDPVAGSRSYGRNVDVKRQDWFTVAIGDVTIGKNASSGPASLATGNDSEFNNLYTNTRGAFYTKGQLNARTRVTASLDTGETAIRNIFSNLDNKDPAQLLRRLDSTQYIPTYGDDSSTVEDAPTQGRFYFRLDHDDSKLILGNYVLDAAGADLVQLDRGLYGALGDYLSKGVTSFGERKTRVTGFASEPGTLPAREEFRGTGGSAYFLGRQDLTIGSERLRVEIRDRTSGLVIESRDLRPYEDYDIDYLQGRVLLTHPLSSTAQDGRTVRDGSATGNQVVMVARYEYSPTIGDLGGYTYGGRATQWLGEHLRFGLTAQRESTGTVDQKIWGGDMLLRYTALTFLRAEVASSDGPGFDQSNSIDGGLNFVNVSNPGTAGARATSWKTEGAVALSDFFGGDEAGKLSAYYEHLGAGFSGLGRLTARDGDRWGGKAAIPLAKGTLVTAGYDSMQSATYGASTALDFGLEQSLGPITGKVGYRHEDRQPSALLPGFVGSGTRDDIALQFGHDSKAGWGIFGFAQATLNRDAGRAANNRAGIGGRYEVTDNISVNGEVSGGDGGLGANVGVTRHIGENTESYLTYGLSTSSKENSLDSSSLLTRSNYGTLTIGGRTRFGSSLSIHGEERLGFGATAKEQVHSYGMEFTPGDRWSFAATFENGQISDPLTGTFDRTAATGTVGYSGGGIRFASAIEARFEDGPGRKQESWLTRNTLGIEVNPSWRLLGRLNVAISDADQSSILDAGFVEGVVGAAYRPIENNRLNMLFKYTYLKDTSTFGQLSGSGTSAAPKQRNQVLSIDANYKLAKWLTIGGKYGYRFGEVALSRDSNVFLKSGVQLAVLRGDIHVVNKWDFTAEGRYFKTSQAKDQRFGAVVGIYREIADNARFGVGYSFSDYSDDLTNVEAKSRGWFLNMIGKY
jgi:hypothetical protein